MTREAIETARLWFRQNRRDVLHMCASDTREHRAPRNLSRPDLWSGRNWRWFLEKHGTKFEISFLIAELCAHDPDLYQMIIDWTGLPARENMH